MGQCFAAAAGPEGDQRYRQAAGRTGRAGSRGVFAHGLRSGYLTEAANRGIPLLEAMEQSRHRSVQQASEYYNHAIVAAAEHRVCLINPKALSRKLTKGFNNRNACEKD